MTAPGVGRILEETGDLTLRLNGQTRYEIGSVLDCRG